MIFGEVSKVEVKKSCKLSRVDEERRRFIAWTGSGAEERDSVAFLQGFPLASDCIRKSNRIVEKGAKCISDGFFKVG